MPPRSQVPLTVFTVLVNNLDQVLFLRRFNTGFGDGRYCLPGGHVEPAERILDAAKRETLEEVGIEINESQVVGVIHSDVDREYLHFIVMATQPAWTGTARNMETDQCDDITWRPWGQWPDNTLPCIRAALDNIQAGIFFGEHFPSR